ncbi:MAG: cytidine deaminase [Planctomycetes bacterium]|nr:cytidine deaminase [Planctomycetota bacterium]
MDRHSKGSPERPSDSELAALRAAAREATERAYGPYSGVHVGAALLTNGGRVFAGCNVENASYGLTVCAERNAVARAVAEGERDLRAILIDTNQPRGLAPCGACRQVLHEFAPELWVVLVRGDDLHLARLSDYLPDAFGPADLG